MKMKREYTTSRLGLIHKITGMRSFKHLVGKEIESLNRADILCGNYTPPGRGFDRVYFGLYSKTSPRTVDSKTHSLESILGSYERHLKKWEYPDIDRMIAQYKRGEPVSKAEAYYDVDSAMRAVAVACGVTCPTCGKITTATETSRKDRYGTILDQDYQWRYQRSVTVDYCLEQCGVYPLCSDCCRKYIKFHRKFLPQAPLYNIAGGPFDSWMAYLLAKSRKPSKIKVINDG
jgi:hypothetical protein